MNRSVLLLLALAVATSLAAVACGDGLPSPSAGSNSPSSSGGTKSCSSCGTVVNGASPTVIVQANDQDQFSPKSVSIAVGDVVEWKDVGSQAHTVTFPDDSSVSDNLLSSGQTFEVKFTQAGSFYYQCNFHLSLGMTGTVNVSGGASAPSASASASP